ncbi:hypothetical protein Purlil1_7190 [Purpureocillium lilacinum]|uniref:Uncharacterized protein n=1 Tax=Purpureocillium lilacinum TaxID=33203 RepID=A0ABR0BWS1_PURLI|nr:hypothetical protein Purlil1_7190 [Purpureocillium lilacinum]
MRGEARNQSAIQTDRERDRQVARQARRPSPAPHLRSVIGCRLPIRSEARLGGRTHLIVTLQGPLPPAPHRAHWPRRDPLDGFLRLRGGDGSPAGHGTIWHPLAHCNPLAARRHVRKEEKKKGLSYVARAAVTAELTLWRLPRFALSGVASSCLTCELRHRPRECVRVLCRHQCAGGSLPWKVTTGEEPRCRAVVAPITTLDLDPLASSCRSGPVRHRVGLRTSLVVRDIAVLRAGTAITAEVAPHAEPSAPRLDALPGLPVLPESEPPEAFADRTAEYTLPVIDPKLSPNSRCHWCQFARYLAFRPILGAEQRQSKSTGRSHQHPAAGKVSCTGISASFTMTQVAYQLRRMRAQPGGQGNQRTTLPGVVALSSRSPGSRVQPPRARSPGELPVHATPVSTSKLNRVSRICSAPGRAISRSVCCGFRRSSSSYTALFGRSVTQSRQCSLHARVCGPSLAGKAKRHQPTAESGSLRDRLPSVCLPGAMGKATACPEHTLDMAEFPLPRLPG